MKPIKFAYILMGKDFSEDQHIAHITNTHNDATIIGVDNLADACQTAKKLQALGYECIELCGAFEESGARAVIEATENKLAIGYSIHLESQNQLFDSLFA